MGTRATKPILAALAASSVLLGGGAAADDAGERAFANELRILPAFTAQLEHTVTVAKKTSSEVARLEMDPRRASFRLRYRTLPIEIWRAGTKVVTMPSGAGKPPRPRAESAGKLAALLFMVGSGVIPRHMDVTLAQRQAHVDYVLTPRDQANPIERIQYEFDHVGLRRATVFERSGAVHRIELSEHVSHEAVGAEAVDSDAGAPPPTPTLTT